MARPLRLEFAGALYHVTSRGDRREGIFLNDEDRQTWLDVLGLVCERFNWQVHAYCQMSNHYLLLVETPDGNLSVGMRQLNGLYTQRFNRRHGLVGHLLQGRYKVILVQKEAHLLELARYVVLNPVRAGMAAAPEDWPWSSYLTCLHDQPAPKWLDTDWLLGQFGTQLSQARQAYQHFVMAGRGVASPLLATRNQLLLGDDAFVALHREPQRPEQLRELSLAHKRSLALPLCEFQACYANRNQVMFMAYRSGAYTMAQIAAHFTVHYMTGSRAVRQCEEEMSEGV